MRRLETLQLEVMVAGVNCGKKYDAWNGVACGLTLFLVFTPAAPLALATGNVCLILAAGHMGGCYQKF